MRISCFAIVINIITATPTTGGKCESLEGSGVLSRVCRNEIMSEWLKLMDPNTTVWRCDWSQLEDATALALSFFITNWHLFIQSILLYKHELLDGKNSIIQVLPIRCTFKIISNTRFSNIFADSSEATTIFCSHLGALGRLLTSENLPLVFASHISAVFLSMVYCVLKKKIQVEMQDALELVTDALIKHELSYNRLKTQSHNVGRPHSFR